MKTKPEDVSSTILPSSSQEGLHLLSSEKEYRGECRSESSSSEQKRESQGGQTQVRDPGFTPRPLPQSCTTSSHTRDPEGKGLKPGATSHRLHCRGVQLARVHQIQHSPAETGFWHQEMYRDKTPHKEKSVPTKLECRALHLSEWEVGAEKDPVTQCTALGLACWMPWPLSKTHSYYWIRKRGPKNVVTSFLL